MVSKFLNCHKVVSKLDRKRSCSFKYIHFKFCPFPAIGFIIDKFNVYGRDCFCIVIMWLKWELVIE